MTQSQLILNAVMPALTDGLWQDAISTKRLGSCPDCAKMPSALQRRVVVDSGICQGSSSFAPTTAADL
ncbi:MAG: hypothetical protein EBU11_11100 [Gammaproteobacteria bacterium]|nr:hypothetical protein [Gammaproteobacteria bacterium]